MICDSEIQWRRKRKYHQWYELNGLVTAPFNEAGAAIFANGALLQSSVLSGGDTITSPSVRMSSLVASVWNLQFKDAGKKFYGRIPLPYNIDPQFNISLRVNWSMEGTTAGTLLWSIYQAPIIKSGSYLSIAGLEIAGNLKTMTSAHSGNLSTDINMWSTYNNFRLRLSNNGRLLNRDDIENGASLQFSISPTDQSGTTGVIVLLGLELSYTPIYTVGMGMQQEALLI